MRWSCTFFVIAVLSAQTLGTVRGIVHDPQHRPLENATVTLGAKTAQSDSNGDFTISDVPEGPATLRVSAEGFAPFEEQISVTRDKSPVLHLQLELAEVKQTAQSIYTDDKVVKDSASEFQMEGKSGNGKPNVYRGIQIPGKVCLVEVMYTNDATDEARKIAESLKAAK